MATQPGASDAHGEGAGPRVVASQAGNAGRCEQKPPAEHLRARLPGVAEK